MKGGVAAEACLSAGPKSRHRLPCAAGLLLSAVVGALFLLYVRKPGDGGGQAARYCLCAGGTGLGIGQEAVMGQVRAPEGGQGKALVGRFLGLRAG